MTESELRMKSERTSHPALGCWGRRGKAKPDGVVNSFRRILWLRRRQSKKLATFLAPVRFFTTMQFLLAANGLVKSYALECIKSLDALGYPWTMYDLGGLGFGLPFSIHSKTFQTKGHYQTSFRKRTSKAMHKPHIIANFLESATDFVVYLDADTFVRQRIDEIVGNYDVGVTLRPRWEWEKKLEKVNAGVIFLRPTDATKNFVQKWVLRTQTIGNDQAALASILREPDCVVAEFPAKIYNWSYFRNLPSSQTKIIHFKASTRSGRAFRDKWQKTCDFENRGIN